MCTRTSTINTIQTHASFCRCFDFQVHGRPRSSTKGCTTADVSAALVFRQGVLFQPHLCVLATGAGAGGCRQPPRAVAAAGQGASLFRSFFLFFCFFRPMYRPMFFSFFFVFFIFFVFFVFFVFFCFFCFFRRMYRPID